MRQSNLFLGVIVLVATLLLVVYGIAALSPINPDRRSTNEADQFMTPLQRPTASFGNPSRGPRDAKTTIFLFGDYLCQPCAELEVTVAQLLLDLPNDVRVIWKDMPNVQRHSEAINAAVAARCADDQGAFWEYHDVLMKDQGQISLNNYVPFAAQLGLDLQIFQGCLDGKVTQPLVQRDYEEGLRLRIESTPTMFIGERRIEGAVSYEQLRGFVDAAMSEIRPETAPEQPAAAPTE